MASGWDFLAGFANTLGGQLQQRQQQEQEQKLRKMQEDAAMKRDMFLAEYRAKVDAENKAAEREATKGDVVAQFTDPETGSVYGRTKGGTTIPLNETSREYRQSLRDKAASELEYKRSQSDAANARAERSRRPSASRSSGRKEPKAPKPETTSFELAGNDGRIKIRPADNIGPAAPMNVRPALEQIPDRDEEAEVTPVFVEPQGGAPVATGQPAKPSREEIVAKAQAAISAGADPGKVQARVAELMKQYGYAP